jgi:PEP-CTERM motif
MAVRTQEGGMGMKVAVNPLVAVLTAVALLSVNSGAKAALKVVFIPGTYYLAESYLGPPVDTLSVTISSGTAYFDLSGVDNETFSVPNDSTPTGHVGRSPYYLVSSPVTSSWLGSSYPYLDFWTNAASGGVTAGTLAGSTLGTNLFNTFTSTEGTGQVFTLSVPEPSTWAMMGLGFAGLAFAGYRRAERAAFSAG